MGVYLGQLPPAELARFKAELAETLVAHFCYPRFFDYRTESLQMRPVDRAKRQEVWLYLSAVDFATWSRLDLTSPEFQHQIERLLIQFMQRNRSFFGRQGRRRMSDVRTLIGSCALSIVTSLRNHLMGQRPPGAPAFGNPRPTVSWAAPTLSKQPAQRWEQISTATMILQQQLQELRGEIKSTFESNPDRPGISSASATPAPSGAIPRIPATGELNGQPQAARPFIPRPLPSATDGKSVLPTNSPGTQGTGARNALSANNQATGARGAIPASTQGTGARNALPASSQATGARNAIPSAPSTRKPEPQDRSTPVRRPEQSVPTFMPSTPPKSTIGRGSSPSLSDSGTSLPTPTAPHPARLLSPSPEMPNASSTSSAQREVMTVGEDDIAIFEQMRHQLLIWLRIEAVSAGLDISSQGPTQLLELLRQQSRVDETRLQVVSTLLNLANQVIKTGLVTALDYKQALMFHLMHTRRS